MNDLQTLETDKISKLIRIYSVPAIIGMVVNAIYNIVDRMFIGKYVGEQALAGLTITFPLTNILFAVALLIGVGSSSLISNKLGEKDIDGASSIFGVSLTYSVIATFIMCGLSYVFRNELLVILGGTPDIVVYAEEYLNIILLGFIFVMVSYVLSNNIRSEGKPLITMTSMSIACITNIIFDYLFIAVLGLGVKGAAWATFLGQFVGLCIVSMFYLRKQSVLKFKKSMFKLNFNVIQQINKIGLSSCIINIGNAVTLILMNNNLTKYGGAGAIAAMSVAFSVQTMVFMPLFGLRQGLQVIMGYNYGANNNKRVYETLFTGLKYGIVFSTIFYIAIMVFPELFVSFFLKSDSEIFGMAVNCLRIFFAILPLYPIMFFGLALFQSTKRGNLANIVSITKQIVVMPLIYIFPLFLGFYGVYASVIFTDFITILIVCYFVVKEYKTDMNNR